MYAEEEEDTQGNPPVELPPLHGEGDDKTADEEEDDVVEIDGGDYLAAHDTEGRKENDGEE